MASDAKSAAAFRTIGEVATLTGVAPHILRYWEGRFPQLRPVTRAGNRRYYRPADVTPIERIDQLLHRDGYTVKGVQQLLASERGAAATKPALEPVASAQVAEAPSVTVDGLRAVRDLLTRALREDSGA